MCSVERSLRQNLELLIHLFIFEAFSDGFEVEVWLVDVVTLAHFKKTVYRWVRPDKVSDDFVN